MDTLTLWLKPLRHGHLFVENCDSSSMLQRMGIPPTCQAIIEETMGDGFLRRYIIYPLRNSERVNRLTYAV